MRCPSKDAATVACSLGTGSFRARWVQGLSAVAAAGSACSLGTGSFLQSGDGVVSVTGTDPRHGCGHGGRFGTRAARGRVRFSHGGGFRDPNTTTFPAGGREQAPNTTSRIPGSGCSCGAAGMRCAPGIPVSSASHAKALRPAADAKSPSASTRPALGLGRQRGWHIPTAFASRVRVPAIETTRVRLLSVHKQKQAPNGQRTNPSLMNGRKPNPEWQKRHYQTPTLSAGKAKRSDPTSTERCRNRPAMLHFNLYSP